jgi:hypothetical protein
MIRARAECIGSRAELGRELRHGLPFLMAVWPVASHTRTPLGTGIMAAFQAHA